MKITKAVVDSDLRTRVFSAIFDEFTNDAFKKINDRQYGIILTDKNGVERYVRIGAIVAEEREDMTARELMEKEINDYKEKQEAKAQKEKEKQEKIARDKEKREKEEK
jgi:glucosamine 6-phosphate synthetase-like amidotransferase/phosphosugar isomerase protein